MLSCTGETARVSETVRAGVQSAVAVPIAVQSPPVGDYQIKSCGT